MNIRTNNGYEFAIDDEDFDKIKGFSWRGVPYKKKVSTGEKRGYTTYIYANVYRNNKRTVLALHSLLMNPPKGMHTDHVNGNGLDNRKANLRICTPLQNQWNRQTKGIRTIKYNTR